MLTDIIYWVWIRLPCTWDRTTIVVMNDVCVNHPYLPENVIGGASAANERVRKVVSSFLHILCCIGRTWIVVAWRILSQFCGKVFMSGLICCFFCSSKKLGRDCKVGQVLSDVGPVRNPLACWNFSNGGLWTASN